jgi:hypothetical protein
MTLDELDEALASGEVDTSTRLWIPGMAEWEALGSVANLEDGSPLECTPGAMLEYGLDAERAHSSEEESGHPSVGDIRDYDPFSFPPPSDGIPDPNRALWASISPPAVSSGAVPSADVSPAAVSPAAVSSQTGVRSRIEPWWRVEGRAPWIGLMLTGTFLLCLSLLGVARLLFVAPGTVAHGAETMARAPAAEAVPPAPTGASAAAVDAVGISAQARGGAPTLVRYDEPERAGAPRAQAASVSHPEKVSSKLQPTPHAVKPRPLTKDASRARR